MNETKHFFNRYGASWDRTRAQDPERIRAMLLLADLAPHSVILDVGCGTGVLEPYLLAHRPSAILGVDFAASMIEAAREKCRHEAVRFVCADILDVTGLSCDCCFVYNTFQHFSEPQRIINHITTLLRPGGRIVISHTQGIRVRPSDSLPDGPFSLTQGITKLLSDYHLDAVVDNNAMLLVSGLKK